MQAMRRCAVIAALSSSLVLATPSAAQPPSPKQFLGHDVGEDHFLANYTQLRAYWDELAKRSDRVAIETYGTTSYGQPMVLAVVTSPANHARIAELRSISERLARGRDAGREVARELAERGRATVWIDGGLHATEAVAGQNILELVWRMVSRDDAEVRRILDEVVLLVCPANPDGMELIANAYMATRRVGGIPVLYQRYIGHDNNRDFYACTQPEAQAISRMHYARWYPQIVYNHHQTAPRGTIIFTPPFRDPFNYNVDPIVVRGIDLVASHMNQRFATEQKPGVISRSGASYSTWWNGGLRTTVYFHNMIGILTESFGSPNPTRIVQDDSRRLPYVDYPDPIATQPWHARQTIEYLQTANFAILDLASRYRREFLENVWIMARRSIERGSRDHWTPTPKLLAVHEARVAEARGADGSSRGGRRRGGERADAGDDAGGDSGGREREAVEEPLPAGAIDAFADPALRDARAYVLPSDARDFPAATRFVHALRHSGVEVHEATAPVALPGRAPAPEGSYVVRADQAFRPHVIDMFEPQWHPDDIGSSGEPVRPYDSAGWTLAMQMGVDFVRVLDGLDAKTVPLEGIEVPFKPGSIAESRAGWFLSHTNGNLPLAVNRLLARGHAVIELGEPIADGGTTWPAGTLFVPNRGGASPALFEIALTTGADCIGAAAMPAARVPQRALRRPRIGLFDVWGGEMATGWTEWVLRRFEFPVELVFGDALEAGDLRERYDVLLFCTGLPTAGARDRRDAALERGNRSGEVAEDDLEALGTALPPFEDWSTMAARRTRPTSERSIPALREFVERGGRVLAFGQQAERLIRHFDLPIRAGAFVTGDGEPRLARSSEFFVPSSLLWLDVDTRHALGRGVSPRIAAMFRRGPVLEVTDPNAGVAVVARWRDDDDVLASGWAIGTELLRGKAAVLEVPIGSGSVVLYGADVLFRGQPLASFPLVFNALLVPAE